MVAVLGYNFLASSAKAKIVNMATNLGALAFFLPSGALLWGLGLVLGLVNMAGGYVGAPDGRHAGQQVHPGGLLVRRRRV